MTETKNNEKTAYWMGNNWELIKNAPLNKLCLPGSHDSGTYHDSYTTNYASNRVTKTQRKSIYEQLEEGVRVFDLRPIIWKDGDKDATFYTAHWSKLDFTPPSSTQYQGLIGAKLENIFSKIQLFLSSKKNCQELIILDFSHFLDPYFSHGKSPLGIVEIDLFKKLLNEALGEWLICLTEDEIVQFDRNQILIDRTINDLISQGNIIALVPEEFHTGNREARSGIWNKIKYFPTLGEYSGTDNINEMISGQLKKLHDAKRDRPFIFRLCWQLTLSKLQSTPVGTQSILELAETANKALYSNISEWISTKLINQNIYPNTINTDDCNEATTHVVELCLRICKITIPKTSPFSKT